MDVLSEPPKKRSRGTSNGNSSGSAEDRRRRKMWLLETYAADQVMVKIARPNRRDQWVARFPAYLEESIQVWAEISPLAVLTVHPACRCYRCGKLLIFETLTVDRIIPGCRGGTYRRNNIRPACAPCNEKTGGATRRKGKKRD